MQYPSFLTSSVDQQKLSLTVRGLLVAVVPLIMMLTGWTEDQMNTILDLIQEIVFIGTGLLASAWTLWGLVRKIGVALNFWPR